MNTMLELFGVDYFSELELKSRVPGSAFKKFKAVQRGEEELSLEVADVIANAVKDWATERGATHFTHWFQPLTDLTAEKHESFVTATPDGTVLSQFSGKEIIKGETDASSFPSGGLRATFEARGNTIWDTNSPMFIRGAGTARTLYIPTAFIGYNGEALDKKVPLLRATQALNVQALRIQKILGDTETTRVDVTLGCEQEYFLIEKAFYDRRQDIALAGRTLFGSLPPKGQELSDHYYGTIKDRVKTFMGELDAELWKIGLIAKTEHNEVAPNQFELALMFGACNVAVDQNHLVMDTIKKVATRHGLAALLHEKPFEEINGSGKHCNWSLATDTGVNLLDPDTLTADNLQYLVYIMAVIEGVDRYADVLRSTTATPGNDHRLGGHEAPPAIISIFLGEPLTNLLENVEHIGKTKTSEETIHVGAKIPAISKNFSDRNRTSPFAYTGNKFEFRMPGSSAAVSTPMFVIATIVADILKEYADILEKEKGAINPAIIKLVKEHYAKHKRIIFNGNGYDEAWVKEAHKRKLSNLANTVEALPVYIKPETIALFERHSVLSAAEMKSRYEVYIERYDKQSNIDLSIAIRMAKNEIYPSVVKYVTKISKMIVSASKALGDEKYLQYDKEHLEKVLKLKTALKDTISDLSKGLEEADATEDTYKRALFYRDKLFPIYEEMRKIVDQLELLVDKSDWSIPTYFDLLFKL
ncbi:MAG: glutamine synthetase III [Fusobacteriaceae bacterium]|nr:glutamine synthetase III [Fusobacteriaceae bacterium]